MICFRRPQALQSELADEQAMQVRREALERALRLARTAEVAAEAAVREGVPRLAAAQETWYSLAALKSGSPARSRSRESGCGRSRTIRASCCLSAIPDELEREAARVAAQEHELANQLGQRAQTLEEATTHRTTCEDAHRSEENRLAGLIRAAADRREGLARLTGQVNSLRSRGEAAAAEISRLTAAQHEAAERADQASRAFTALETKVAGLDAGEHGLDAEHEAALQTLDGLERQQAELRRQEQLATQERAALAARVEALRVGLDAQGRLLGAAGGNGSTRRLAGLGGGVDQGSVPARDRYCGCFRRRGRRGSRNWCPAAVDAFDHLKAEDLGRAGLLIGELVDAERRIRLARRCRPQARYAIDVVDVPDRLAAAVQRMLRKVARRRGSGRRPDA